MNILYRGLICKANKLYQTLRSQYDVRVQGSKALDSDSKQCSEHALVEGKAHRSTDRTQEESPCQNQFFSKVWQVHIELWRHIHHVVI